MRAIATRWRIPPDNWCGYLCASRSTLRPTLPIQSRARSRRSACGTPWHSSPNAMLSSHRAIVERGVILKDHAAVRAGTAHRLARYEHVPVVAGCCGLSPAMRRRIVDFPHPDGPRIVTNSRDCRGVVDREGDVPDRGEAVVERLADVVEQHDGRRHRGNDGSLRNGGRLWRLRYVGQLSRRRSIRRLTVREQPALRTRAAADRYRTRAIRSGSRIAKMCSVSARRWLCHQQVTRARVSRSPARRA